MILRGKKVHLNGIEHLRIKKIQLYLRGASWGEHNETANMGFTVLPLEGREPGDSPGPVFPMEIQSLEEHIFTLGIKTFLCQGLIASAEKLFWYQTKPTKKPHPRT